MRCDVYAASYRGTTTRRDLYRWRSDGSRTSFFKTPMLNDLQQTQWASVCQFEDYSKIIPIAIPPRFSMKEFSVSGGRKAMDAKIFCIPQSGIYSLRVFGKTLSALLLRVIGT